MEIEQIKSTVRTFAARLDVPIAEVEAGETLRRTPHGVTSREGDGGTVLLIDPAFDEFEDIEQEAVLAWALMSMAVSLRSVVLPFLSVLLLTALVVAWPLDALYSAAADAGVGPHDSPWNAVWLLPVAWAGLLLTGFLIWKPLWVPWKRWVVSQTDREVVRTFGWDVMDAMLAVERRHLSAGALERRLARLDRLRAADGG